MDRPYIVCHILSALNGKISGSFFGTKAASELWLTYFSDSCRVAWTRFG